MERLSAEGVKSLESQWAKDRMLQSLPEHLVPSQVSLRGGPWFEGVCSPARGVGVVSFKRTSEAWSWAIQQVLWKSQSALLVLEPLGRPGKGGLPPLAPRCWVWGPVQGLGDLPRAVWLTKTARLKNAAISEKSLCRMANYGRDCSLGSLSLGSPQQLGAATPPS